MTHSWHLVLAQMFFSFQDMGICFATKVAVDSSETSLAYYEKIIQKIEQDQESKVTIFLGDEKTGV